MWEPPKVSWGIEKTVAGLEERLKVSLLVRLRICKKATAEQGHLPRCMVTGPPLEWECWAAAPCSTGFCIQHTG